MWFYRNRFMKIFHGFNKEYEWRVMIAISLALFVTLVIGVTIAPVLRASQDLLLIETKKRGIQFANEIKRLNTNALARRKLIEVRTSFLEEVDSGVKYYELLDMDKRIISPTIKRNQFTNDPYSSPAVDFFKNEENKNKTFSNYVGFGKIVIAKALISYNKKKGYEEVIGVIVIYFSPSTLIVSAKQNASLFLESWATSILVAIIFFGIIYYLTARPLQELRGQAEKVLRGDTKEIKCQYLFGELLPLKQSISSITQRLREFQNDGDSSDFVDIEDDSKYVAQLDEFMQGAPNAVLILNSEKNVHALNEKGEDLLGFRNASSKGVALENVSRDQDIAATILSLCDRSSSLDGVSQTESYELNGSDYNICINSLIGKDNFAKGFYISFVIDE